jgi:hypothetical protein
MVLIEEVQTVIYCKLKSIDESKTPQNKILKEQKKN